jgi:hypothetical protein
MLKKVELKMFTKYQKIDLNTTTTENVIWGLNKIVLFNSLGHKSYYWKIKYLQLCKKLV